MSSGDFPKSIRRSKISPDTMKQVGTATNTMDVDQKHHYDTRAAIYDKQNELPRRAARLRRMDEYYWEKLGTLLRPGELTYLDFGCATATHTKQFLAGLTHNPVLEGYGVDISPKCLALAAQVLPDFTFIAGGADKIDFENKFDLMTSLYHVLGHLPEEELELFFHNASRGLKPGGILCFDVQKMSLTTRIFKGGKRYSTYITKHPDDPNRSVVKDEGNEPLVGSIGTFTKKHVVYLARKNNLEVVELDTLKDQYDDMLIVILRKKAGY